MGLIDKARRRRYRARLVLWGGRRYDVQVGSERDRASVRIRAFFTRERVGTPVVRYVRHGMGTGTGEGDTVWGEWGAL